MRTQGKKKVVTFEALKHHAQKAFDGFLESATKCRSIVSNNGSEQPSWLSHLTPKLQQFFRHYPHVRQHNAMDCGPTCLAMISQFHNRPCNLNLVRELAGTSRYGTSFLTLAETAEKLGYLARGVRANYAGLMKLKLPLLCHWKGNHFVVLYEIDEHHATIGDPAIDVMHLDRSEFEELYSGTALELTPVSKLEEQFKSRSPFAILIPLAQPHKAVLRDIFIATFVYQILQLFIPLFTQVIVDVSGEQKARIFGNVVGS